MALGSGHTQLQAQEGQSNQNFRFHLSMLRATGAQPRPPRTLTPLQECTLYSRLVVEATKVLHSEQLAQTPRLASTVCPQSPRSYVGCSLLLGLGCEKERLQERVMGVQWGGSPTFCVEAAVRGLEVSLVTRRLALSSNADWNTYPLKPSSHSPLKTWQLKRRADGLA